MDGAVFLEIRERTQSGLLIIRQLKPESWPADITVLPSLLELKSGGGSKSIPLPPEVRIVPSSCRGLQYVPGDGLHMRLRVQADCSKKLMPSVHKSLKSKMSCTLYCQSCGNSIIPGWTFLRVLSLPDENWSDLVEEWCCHANPFHESLLHPQNGDCFLAHNYFLVNSGEELTGPGAEVLPPESQDAGSPSSSCISNSKTDSRIICKRCKTLLGEVMSSGVAKYYFTELFVQPSEDVINMIPRSDFIQSVVAQCLVELSAARSTFRFSIQATDGTVYILVWLLNSDTLLMESAGNLESSNVFTLLESTTSSDSRSSEIWKAIKVLYHPCIKNRNKDLVDAWENDFGVHPLTFPSKTCLELLLILSQSNASLPPSLRRMDFFQVAFLKM
ncbi:E3 ubiquitin-protein ligase E3D isoform X2 [Varanus komodoensis]|uniref:E3 ubiquitin-protein ligase E3D isoform X2 n=1 Tax=Varanus komodoensis TaxID=61221 RepID=UPI001CF798F1|nr:E3 ubiquitin-protein ligase E3D isoform X2 [Varanus komodoensis]